MKREDLSDTIMELNADDTAYAVVETIIRLGQHGRDAMLSIRGQIEGLTDSDKDDFEEGWTQLDDVRAGRS